MGSSRDYLTYFLASLVIFAGAAGMYDDVAVPAGGSSSTAAKTTLTSLPEPFAGIDRLRLVLIGADDRPHEVGRSDTLMVMWINPGTKRAAIMSIPRDLRVSIPGYGVTKINHAYAHGGPELTVRTVAELLGIPIDGYVKVDFQGFVQAVDTLGGVDLLVEDVEGKGRGMNYDDNWGNLHIHLTPGWHHLNGYEAMGFCRYRKSNTPGLGDGDFRRAERQQQFLRAMVEQKLRVQNLPQLLKAGREIMQCVETTLSWRDCVDLVRLLKSMEPTAIKTLLIPVHDAPDNGGYYCTTTEDDVRNTLADIESHLEGIGDDAWRVAVLNGSGVEGLADRTATALQKAGFDVVSTGEADSRGYDATRIRCLPEDRPVALAVAAVLGAGQLEMAEMDEPSREMPEARVSVVVGRDLARDRSLSAKPAGPPAQ